MQTIILNEQESEQLQTTVNAGQPIHNLVLGLLVCLLLVLFDRRQNRLPLPEAQPEQRGGWGRTLLIIFTIALVLFVLINLIMGP